MLSIDKKNYQNHPFHLVFPSPWPFYSSLSLLSLTLNGVLIIQDFIGITFFVLLSFILLFITMIFWFKDIITESSYLGNHTSGVRKGLNVGIGLFIISEALFFLAIFWTYFHSCITPTIELATKWPPTGVESIDPFEFPFLNTLILLFSGISVTYSHHSLIEGNRKSYIISLLFTIILALFFTILQVIEYSISFFTVSDSIFGSCFYIGTGFHGFHVIIGTIFLLFGLIRSLFYHFTEDHHLGLEFAILYWHFVDIIWLILFISFYYLGS